MKSMIATLILVILVLVAPFSGTVQTASATPTTAVLYSTLNAFQANYVSTNMSMPNIPTPSGMAIVERVFTSSDGSRLFVSGYSSSYANKLVQEMDRTLHTNTATTQGSAISFSSSSTLIGMSADGNHLYVKTYPGKLNIIDVNSGPNSISFDTTHVIDFSANPSWVIAGASSPDSTKIYVLGTTDTFFNTTFVRVYNASTRAQIGSSITVGGQYSYTNSGMVVGSDGRIWVANPGNVSADCSSPGHTLSVIDPSSSYSVTTVDLGTSYTTQGCGPVSLAIRPDGHYVYAANYWGTSGGDGIVTVVDATNAPPTVATRITLGASNNPRPQSVALSPDGSYLFVAEGFTWGSPANFHIAVISTASNALDAQIPQLSSSTATTFLMAAPYVPDFGIGDDYPSAVTVGGTTYNLTCSSWPSTCNADPWAYYARNCTSFAAWRLYRDGHDPINFSDFSGLGTAKFWDTAVADPTNWVKTAAQRTPLPGDIAQWDENEQGVSSSGHVAYVTKVAGSDVWVEDYNWSGTGVYRGPVKLSQHAPRYIRFP